FPAREGRLRPPRLALPPARPGPRGARPQGTRHGGAVVGTIAHAPDPRPVAAAPRSAHAARTRPRRAAQHGARSRGGALRQALGPRPALRPRRAGGTRGPAGLGLDLRALAAGSAELHGDADWSGPRCSGLATPPG